MIERLYVNNFRCLENFSIDFGPDRASMLVIGKNGSGKSTLRQAFGVFQNICRGSNRVRDLIAGSDFTQRRKHIPMRFEVELTLANKRFKYAISFEMPENFREARVAEEGLSVDGNVIFSRQQAQVNLPGGSTFRLDWHVAALPVINERPGESSIQEIKSFFASMILIAPIPANMSGFSEEESVELQHDAANFSAWLNALILRYPAAYNVLFGYLKSVIPDLASFENVPRGEKGKQLLVKFEQEEANRVLSIDFKQLSDGEKCFFLSALIVASNKINGPIFCMWDEPDNHLSLPEVGHFITQLRKMTNQNGQFIATSHHPETIRRFSDETTLVLTRKSHLEPTIVRTLAAFQYSGDLIAALIRDEVIG
jgi:predicted ATPase